MWVIDISRNDGKTVKIKNALRVIPLTDGAYRFDLQGFVEFVDKADSRLFALGLVSSRTCLMAPLEMS